MSAKRVVSGKSAFFRTLAVAVKRMSAALVLQSVTRQTASGPKPTPPILPRRDRDVGSGHASAREPPASAVFPIAGAVALQPPWPAPAAHPSGTTDRRPPGPLQPEPCLRRQRHAPRPVRAIAPSGAPPPPSDRSPSGQRNNSTGTGQARIRAVVVEPTMKFRRGECP